MASIQAPSPALSAVMETPEVGEDGSPLLGPRHATPPSAAFPPPPTPRVCGLHRRLACGLLALLVLVVVGIVMASVGSMERNAHRVGARPSPSPSASVSPSASPSASATPSSSPHSVSPSASASATASASPTSSQYSSATSTPLPSRRPQPSLWLFWNGLQGGVNATTNTTTPGTAWYTQLDVNANTSFTTLGPYTADGAAPRNVTIQVDWADHGAVELFANPAFLQAYDDTVRAWNPNARNHSGAIDSCGWPADPNGLGFSRRATCFHEDFSGGWNSSSLHVALAKSCCTQQPVLLPNYTWWPGDPHAADKPEPYSGNIAVDQDDVEFPPGVVRRKNVLRLTAVNHDDLSPQACGGCDDPADPVACPNCHKVVMSSGLVETADLFASGRYDVIAKVPAASGLVWAMWTFHYEEHLPWESCSQFGCYRESYRGVDPPAWPKTTWSGCCGEGCCETRNRPASCPPVSECSCCDAWTPCAEPTLCDSAWGPNEKACMADHYGPDPQFTNNATLSGWKSQYNHEIDIELPANCEGTSVCGQTALPSMNFTQRKELKPGCLGRYNTVNLNNYIYTTTGGTGPSYSNMCVAAKYTDTGEPMQLIGDGKYHKYTIDWHTGGVVGDDGTVSDGRVDFFVDDVYLGSNNVFVPTRASRLVLGMWGPTGHYSWNNWPDDWSGQPGDGGYYMQHAYVSEVKVLPHNEPNDVVYPASYDQPDGCTPFYLANGECHRLWTTTSTRPPVNTSPDPPVLTCSAGSL